LRSTTSKYFSTSDALERKNILAANVWFANDASCLFVNLIPADQTPIQTDNRDFTIAYMQEVGSKQH